jgi:hypothetical protein
MWHSATCAPSETSYQGLLLLLWLLWLSDCSDISHGIELAGNCVSEVVLVVQHFNLRPNNLISDAGQGQQMLHINFNCFSDSPRGRLREVPAYSEKGSLLFCQRSPPVPSAADGRT